MKVTRSSGSGLERAEPVKVHLINCGQDTLEETCIYAADLLGVSRRPRQSWVNVDGLNNLEPIQSLGSEFGLHPQKDSQRDIFNDHEEKRVGRTDSGEGASGPQGSIPRPVWGGKETP